MAGPTFYDRVRETATTTGTGTFTLAGAVTGFRAFTSVLSNGDLTFYCIAHQTAGEWEVGIGTFTTSGTTLARTTVLASSNAGAAVNFSAGTKDVFLTIPAARMFNLGAANDLADNILQRPYLVDYAEKLTANGNTTGSVNVDYSAAQNWSGTLTGNTTLTITNPPASGRVASVTLIVTGNGTATLGITGVHWFDDEAPTDPIANGAVLWIFLTSIDGGTRWEATSRLRGT